MVHAQVCVHLFEAGIFRFQLLELTFALVLHVGMLLAPFVQRGGANLVFPAQVVYARTRILLGQDRQALFFAEFALLPNHSFFSLNVTFFPFEWLREMGSVQNNQSASKGKNILTYTFR